MINNGKSAKDIKLISGSKIGSIFDKYYPDILSRPINDGWNKFISELWCDYKSDGNKSLNGSVFEGIIACCLYRAGILPFFKQAKLAFVPNICFDFIVYTKECGPIILSAKTSLRERYKQAALEGFMMRQVYRRSEYYLLTLDNRESTNINSKINNGEVLGIDKVIQVKSPEFNELIENLIKMHLVKPDKIEIITGNKIVE